MEIAVIGDEEFLLGFRLAGIRKVVPACEKDLEPKLEALLKDRTVGILVIHNEDMDRLAPHLRRDLVESIEPVVISIGRVEEVDLRERIKQAVGVDLWK
jgi:V/A-type H+/Na+-transporting ATPase subunit F